MKKKKLLFVALALCLAAALVAAALCARGPQLDQARLEAIAASAMEKYNIPAVSIRVFHADGTDCAVAEGVRVSGEAEQITEADYFHVGSCAKSVLAYIAAQLVTAGAIDWDTAFFSVFPALQANALEDYRDITLTDLLACRAGIQPYTSGSEAYPDLTVAQDPMLEFAAYLLRQPPAVEKAEAGGFVFEYSNASYTLAAMMLEAVSGLSYRELLDRYIVRVLGIEIFVGWPYEASEDQPWGHYLDADGTLIVYGPDSGYAIPSLIAPSGNLSMTSAGFTTYMQTHLRGLLGEDETLSADVYAYLNQSYDVFALGAWNGKLVGKSYVCFDGTAGTYYARGMIFPDSNFGFTILLNNGSEKAADAIATQLFKARFNLWWAFWM